MTSRSEARPDRPTLRRIHGTIAYAALVLGFPLAMIGSMALVGEFTTTLWIRLTIPALVLTVLPLLLADRLLPKQPGSRKPGLVRDVLAGSYTGAALLLVGLAGSLSAAPLHAEAARLDTRGWTRAAWVAQWMAGPEAGDEPALARVESSGSPAEATPAPLDADASADTPEPQSPPSATTAAPALPNKDADTDADADAPGADVDEPGADADEPDEAEDGPDEAEYSPAELFATYAPVVVSITTAHHGFRSGGTGFLIDDQGTIATNHHVIDDAGEVRVKTLDGVEFDRVELLVSDPQVDLALLRIDPSELGDSVVFARLGDSEAIRVGDPVSVIGNPLGLEHTLTNGIISARRVYEGKRYVQMSAPISPGNSGGPVFDRHGQVIAVSVATMFGGQNLNLAVPVSQLQALIRSDYPNRRSFGASSW